ncbi:MAG: hypothetical protein RL266_991 [Bacteroidota bacterium]|jgi:hypothetical protein
MAKAEQRNKQQNITGLLVYFDGSFIQMLEGAEEDVLDTFDRIKGDSRHEQIIKLFSGETDKRHFPNWKMALEVVDRAKFSEIDSYESLDEGDRFLNQIDDAHMGLKMLRYFYEIKKKQ